MVTLHKDRNSITMLLCLLFALLFCLHSFTHAQTPHGAVTGVVTDVTRARVPGASVTLMHSETNQSRDVVSDETGNFSFPSIPSGAYAVTIKQRGFQVFSANVVIASNAEARVAAILHIGRMMESVAVTANGRSHAAYDLEALEVGATNKLVKGAPYAAEVVTEFVQTLTDGNRIVQRQMTNVYRDSQGRTRKEHFTASSLSNALLGEMPTGFKVISDPVEGVNYLLDEKNSRAQRQFVRPVQPAAVATKADAAANASDNTAPKPLRISGGVLQGGPVKKVQPPYPIEAKAAGVSGAVGVQVTIGTTGEIIAAEAISGPSLLREVATTAASQWRFKPTELSGVAVNVSGIITFNFALTETNNAGSNLKVATLDKQMIEGVECEGTRKVITLPAGAVGNEQAIEIVSETWFSPALQIFVLSKQRDPRFGEKTVRLTNLLRAEPDETLFKVPGNYTINDTRQAPQQGEKK